MNLFQAIACHHANLYVKNGSLLMGYVAMVINGMVKFWLAIYGLG